MSQEYTFEFSGTKEDFFNKIGCFNNNDNQFYWFDSYIIKIVDDEIHFGIERAGHSSGHWFISKITELEDKIEFKGTIQYLGPYKNSFLDETEESILKRVIDKTLVCLLYILVAPFVLIIDVFLFFKRLFDKICHRPTVSLKTKEDKLFDLMENQLGCTRK
ncbi:MAG: hypothetical protein ACI4RM_04460 [Ruminococcus sp.]